MSNSHAYLFTFDTHFLRIKMQRYAEEFCSVVPQDSIQFNALEGSMMCVRFILMTAIVLTGFPTPISNALTIVAEDRAIRIAAGSTHTCLVTITGGVKCWGYNYFDQLGNGSGSNSSMPVDVVGLTGAIEIAGGGNHACVVILSGGVRCWGSNQYGQLGNNTTTGPTTLRDVIGLSSGVTQIAAGYEYTCALTQTGGVKCWGAGHGMAIDHSIPSDVMGLSSGTVGITAGNSHSCAVMNTGAAKCWGVNSQGQLGDGTLIGRGDPTNVIGLDSGVLTVSAGSNHTCAVMNTGAAKCWGANNQGQLGDGTTTNHPIPVDVVGLSSGVTAISTGGDYTCALMSNGNVKCWGENRLGMVGDGTTTDRSVPTDVAGLNIGVVAITTGANHACALTSAGNVKCWGWNSDGQLGYGTSTSQFVPVNVVGLNTEIAAISPGGSRSCALTSTGGVKCWGWNPDGQLGDGTTTDRAIPVDVIGLSSGITAIATGWFHACALTNVGGVKCWGRNTVAQLGDGTYIQRLTSINVMGLSNSIIAISAKGDHTCALTITRGVKCWGSNSKGELGDGTTSDRSSPVDVIGLSSGVSAVATGYAHTCALTLIGSVKCWGWNASGELGDGTGNQKLMPVDVVGLGQDVIAITAGDFYTCALTHATGVKCWGGNSFSQIGDGSKNNRMTPVDVVGLNSGVSAITAGDLHTCALMNGGSVKCWGYNDTGQLGDGTTIDRSSPVDVSGLVDSVTAVMAGSSHTCALTNAGGIKCWGWNGNGQLGDGNGWRETPQDVTGFSAAAPQPLGDAYENDDTCGKATYLSANIATQAHTFDKSGDEDWIRIEMITGTNYSLVANNLTGGAVPGFSLQSSCVSSPVSASPGSFGGEVRLPMNASDYPPGTYYVRINNSPTTTFGNGVSYTLSFRATSNVGAAIIVAGRNGGEINQNVITQTTDLAYNVLLRNGFSKDKIYYLDNQTLRDADGNNLADDIDAAATVANLQNAIVTWAQDKVGLAQPLWIYLADHGTEDRFLVNGDGSNDVITPSMLDDWIGQIEATTGVDQINIIIDSCNSGSFIVQPGSISKRGRAILASTSADRVAQGRPAAPGVVQRMYFGEAVWSALDANLSLHDAFEQAKQATSKATANNQQAWLDDNGDGAPNEATDGLQSDVRGLIGSVSTGGRPFLTWQLADALTGALIVNAQASGGASLVIVEIASPNSSQTYIPGQINLARHDYVTLMHAGNGKWIGSYSGFNVPGTYHLLAYGWDTDGSPAQPTELIVQVKTPDPSVTPEPTVAQTPTSTATMALSSSETPTSTMTPSATQQSHGESSTAFLPILIR